MGFYAVDLFDCPPFRMFTADDCIVAEYIIRQRSFEPMSMRVWCALARPATGIIDVGANVGIYTMAAAALRDDIVIHAFEPNPHAHARLRVNARINKFSNIAGYPFALAESVRVDRLSWLHKGGTHISSGGTLGRTSYEHCETIPCDVRPLDTLPISVGERGLVKIDAEGAEQVVIFGMSKVLAEKPDIIIESFSSEACRLIMKRISPLGYRIYAIDESAMTLREMPALMPAVKSSRSFNRLLTVRDRSDGVLKQFSS